MASVPSLHKYIHVQNSETTFQALIIVGQTLV